MDVWGLTVAAFRRWYVLIPLLLISLTAAFLIGSRSQSEYEVTGAVMLVAPADNPVPSNPYAADSAVQILGIKAMSSSTRNAFAKEGMSSEYEIIYDDDTPVMTLTVIGGSEQTALETGQRLVEYLGTTLDSSQKELGISRGDRVMLTTVDAPDVVNPAEGGTLRVTAILGVLGIVLSFAIAVLVDAILARRSSLGEARAAAEVIEPASGRGTEVNRPGVQRSSMGPNQSDP